MAAVGLGIANLIFGGEDQLQDGILRWTCYAGTLISVLRRSIVIGILVMLFGDPEHFNPNAPVPTSLAFFMDQTHTSKPLFALATSLDLFTFLVHGDTRHPDSQPPPEGGRSRLLSSSRLLPSGPSMFWLRWGSRRCE